jgi:hypothetical protein
MLGQTAKTFSSQDVHAPINTEDSVIVTCNKLETEVYKDPPPPPPLKIPPA